MKIRQGFQEFLAYLPPGSGLNEQIPNRVLARLEQHYAALTYQAVKQHQTTLLFQAGFGNYSLGAGRTQRLERLQQNLCLAAREQSFQVLQHRLTEAFMQARGVRFKHNASAQCFRGRGQANN